MAGTATCTRKRLASELDAMLVLSRKRELSKRARKQSSWRWDEGTPYRCEDCGGWHIRWT